MTPDQQKELRSKYVQAIGRLDAMQVMDKIAIENLMQFLIDAAHDAGWQIPTPNSRRPDDVVEKPMTAKQIAEARQELEDGKHLNKGRGLLIPDALARRLKKNGIDGPYWTHSKKPMGSKFAPHSGRNKT